MDSKGVKPRVLIMVLILKQEEGGGGEFKWKIVLRVFMDIFRVFEVGILESTLMKADV